jgi:hypothetical protein
METAAAQVFGSKIRNRSDLRKRSPLCRGRSAGLDAGEKAIAARRLTAEHAPQPTEYR